MPKPRNPNIPPGSCHRGKGDLVASCCDAPPAQLECRGSWVGNLGFEGFGLRAQGVGTADGTGDQHNITEQLQRSFKREDTMNTFTCCSALLDSALLEVCELSFGASQI